MLVLLEKCINGHDLQCLSSFIISFNLIFIDEIINETQMATTNQILPSFRLCIHCGQVLENREQIKYRDQKPPMCDYYDKIVDCRNKIENDLLIKFNQTYSLLR